MNPHKLHRELRVNARLLAYSLQDFISAILAIMGILFIYPMVWLYVCFFKKIILSAQVRTRRK